METLKSMMDQLTKPTHVVKNESRKDQLMKMLTRYSFGDILVMVAGAECDSAMGYIHFLSEMLSISSDDWIYEGINMQDHRKVNTVGKPLSEILLKFSVPTFRDKEHYAFEEDDFQGVRERANVMFNFIISLLLRIENLLNIGDFDNTAKFLFQMVPNILTFTFEHIESNLWTTSVTVSMANRTMDILKKLYRVETLSELLKHSLTNSKGDQHAHEMILHYVLKLLHNKLTRENWKRSPAVKHVFHICVANTSFPVMSEFLEVVLPPALLFTDDYMTENKILGVTCLSHIIENVGAEELRWYGRADVVYEALRHQLYSRELKLLEVSIPALLAVLKVVERSPASKDQEMRQLTRYDVIFQSLVQDAVGESVLSLRRIYTKYLVDFLDIMGIAVVRHLKQIIELCENYLEIYDGPTEEARFNTLRLLKKTIEVAWPRIPVYLTKLLKILIKMLCDLYIDQTDVKEDTKDNLVELVKQIMILLKLVDTEEVTKILLTLKDVDFPVPCKHILESVCSA